MDRLRKLHDNVVRVSSEYVQATEIASTGGKAEEPRVRFAVQKVITDAGVVAHDTREFLVDVRDYCAQDTKERINRLAGEGG